MSRGSDYIYKKLRREFLLKHGTCVLKLSPQCSLIATDIHHTFSGSSRGEGFLDTATWKSSCRFCHDWAHSKLSSEELRALGLKQ